MYKWASGEIYEGEWVANLRHGRGIFVQPSKGIRFEGEWVDGKQKGSGVLFMEKVKCKMEGLWNGEQLLRGRVTMKDGTVLEGEFKNGKLHGRGKQSSPDGNKKQKKNRKKLVLRPLLLLGTVYEGEFINGERYGVALIRWKDGSFYKGTVKNGLANGRGIHWLANGSRYEVKKKKRINKSQMWNVINLSL